MENEAGTFFKNLVRFAGLLDLILVLRTYGSKVSMTVYEGVPGRAWTKGRVLAGNGV